MIRFSSYIFLGNLFKCMFFCDTRIRFTIERLIKYDAAAAVDLYLDIILITDLTSTMFGGKKK